jgi:glycosyltransferase involved in cell wall biosynthesis
MDKKIKIGIFIDTFYPMVDGVIVGINSIAKLLNQSVDVTVFTAAPRTGDYDDSGLGYKVVRCHSTKIPLVSIDYDLPTPKNDKVFLKALEESELDLVHIRSPFGVGKAGLRYARKHKIPSVITLHSQYKKDFNVHSASVFGGLFKKLITALLMRDIMRVFNGCDECWSVNEASKQVLYEYGINKEPVAMENGTNMLPVADRERAVADINKYCGIDPMQKVLLYVGRIVAVKNVFFIAEVLKALKERGQDFKMIFVGEGVDKEGLKSKLIADGLGDNVYFTGLVRDRDLLADFYVRADLVLFPSFYDTDGVVKKEAAGQKTPIICTEGSIVADTVVKNQNAYTAPDDPEAYAEEIIKVFNNPEKHEIISENARKEIYVTWEQTAQRTIERYGKLIESNKVMLLEKCKKKKRKRRTLKISG